MCEREKKKKKKKRKKERIPLTVVLPRPRKLHENRDGKLHTLPSKSLRHESLGESGVSKRDLDKEAPVSGLNKALVAGQVVSRTV